MRIADTADTYLGARLDARIGPKSKKRVAAVFEAKVPNAATRRAITELEAGKGKRCGNVDDLMADLHAGD